MKLMDSLRGKQPTKIREAVLVLCSRYKNILSTRKDLCSPKMKERTLNV